MSGVRTRRAASASSAAAAAGGEWQHVLTHLETHTVLVHPTDPSIVFAGTVDGVWRSTDRGATFQRANFPDKGKQIWSFLVDSRDARRIYAGGSPVDVYRSDDSGASWRRLPNPGIKDRATAPFAVRVMRMVQHPTRPDEIYAALEVNGVIRTTNGGETWEDCSADLLRLSELPHLKSKIVSDTFAEGMLDGHAITISPADPDAVVLACRMGLFRSADKGQSWQDMEMKRFSPITYGRDVKVAPQDPKTMYCRAQRRRGQQGRRASIAARTQARPGSASTRCRCTAPSCRSACIRPTPSRSTSARATRARCSARRTAARPGLRCRCRARSRTSTRWRAADRRANARIPAAGSTRGRPGD